MAMPMLPPSMRIRARIAVPWVRMWCGRPDNASRLTGTKVQPSPKPWANPANKIGPDPMYSENPVICHNEAPAALMGPLLVVSGDPRIKVGLQLVDRAVDLFAERHPVELIQNGAMEALANSIIRHDDFGALVSAAFFGKRVMVSPSGTRGVGSTKVRAGRRQTLGCEPELVTWPPLATCPDALRARISRCRVARELPFNRQERRVPVCGSLDWIFTALLPRRWPGKTASSAGWVASSCAARR